MYANEREINSGNPLLLHENVEYNNEFFNNLCMVVTLVVRVVSVVKITYVEKSQ